MPADVNDYSMSVYELEQNFTLALALMRIMVHVTYSVTSRVTGISIRRVGNIFCPETSSFSVGKRRKVDRDTVMFQTIRPRDLFCT